MIFLPFISSFICLYVPHIGFFNLFAHKWHPEKKSPHWLSLSVLFILSNAWIVVLIYATEEQIMRNHVSPSFHSSLVCAGMSQRFCFWFAARFSILTRGVQILPGENTWGAGQILAMILILIPLLGFLKAMVASIGERSRRARGWIQVDYLIQSPHRIYIDSWLSEAQAGQTHGHPIRASLGLPKARGCEVRGWFT